MAKWFASQSVEEINAKKAKLVPKNTTKATLQTWKAFFYILVMVMDSNISTLSLKSSGLDRCYPKKLHRHSLFHICSVCLIGTVLQNIIVIRTSQGIRVHIPCQVFISPDGLRRHISLCDNKSASHWILFDYFFMFEK